MGFFLPPLWFLGVLYVASFHHVKKLAGVFCAITLIVYIVYVLRGDEGDRANVPCLIYRYITVIFSSPRPGSWFIAAPVAVCVLGLFLCCPLAVLWGKKRQMRKYLKYEGKNVQREKIREELLSDVGDVLRDKDEESNDGIDLDIV